MSVIDEIIGRWREDGEDVGKGKTEEIAVDEWDRTSEGKW